MLHKDPKKEALIKLAMPYKKVVHRKASQRVESMDYDEKCDDIIRDLNQGLAQKRGTVVKIESE